jgi:hypothetical protein
MKTWTNLSTTMTNPTTSDFKYLQWNARGLTKAKLEDFRHFLSSVNQEIVILSETYWSSGVAISFKTTTSSRRTAQQNGGGRCPQNPKRSNEIKRRAWTSKDQNGDQALFSVVCLQPDWTGWNLHTTYFL